MIAYFDTSAFVLPDGQMTVTFWSVDAASPPNVESPHTVTLVIDNTPPRHKAAREGISMPMLIRDFAFGAWDETFARKFQMRTHRWERTIQEAALERCIGSTRGAA